MNFKAQFIQKLQHQDDFNFKAAALSLFNYQAIHNPVYQSYLHFLHIDPQEVKELHEIPFLPIEFFKTCDVKTGEFVPEVTFYSSGTTQSVRSRHHVAHIGWYNSNSKRLFEQFYGPLHNYVVLALLPSYLEQGGSSLVYMVDYFVKESGQEEDGFFLKDHRKLLQAMQQARRRGKKVLLIGVSYALLDWAEGLKGAEDFNGVIIMETGGMKGRRRELIREELHVVLMGGFGLAAIHSEYGMTELLSQAYSLGGGIFRTGATMHILLRDLNDPFHKTDQLRSGGINVIDLANVDSCAFIETKDIGKVYEDGSFEVLGRFDNSDIRGCNLLIG